MSRPGLCRGFVEKRRKMMAYVGTRPSTVHSARDGRLFVADTTLEVVVCPTCGVTYAIPERFVSSARAYPGDLPNGRGWSICCPFGHSWHYTGSKTREQKLQEQLDYSRDRAAHLSAKLDQTEASLRGTRANAARTRKELKSVKTRASAGVCPCCNRTFQQLARHMKNKHPGFGD
jgi:protein-arginine kinase activator protein McsA